MTRHLKKLVIQAANRENLYSTGQQNNNSNSLRRPHPEAEAPLPIADSTFSSSYTGESAGLPDTRSDMPSQAPYETLSSGYRISPSIETLLSATQPIPNVTIERKNIGSIAFLEPLDLDALKEFARIRSHTQNIPLREAFIQILFLSENPIVAIEQRAITLYPASLIEEDSLGESDEALSQDSAPSSQYLKRPPKGHGLNVPAIISLYHCFPIVSETSSNANSSSTLIDHSFMSDRNTPSAGLTPSPEIRQKFIERLKAVPDTQFIDYDPINGIWTFKVRHF
jgi:hypothetical protein